MPPLWSLIVVQSSLMGGTGLYRGTLHSTWYSTWHMAQGGYITPRWHFGPNGWGTNRLNGPDLHSNAQMIQILFSKWSKWGQTRPDQCGSEIINPWRGWDSTYCEKNQDCSENLWQEKSVLVIYQHVSLGKIQNNIDLYYKPIAAMQCNAMLWSII